MGLLSAKRTIPWEASAPATPGLWDEVGFEVALVRVLALQIMCHRKVFAFSC